MRITAEDILRDVEVKVEGDQLKLSGQLNLSVQMSEEGEDVPDELEEDVEQTGQELKRLIYRMLAERADQEEVLRMRDGKEGQGIQQRGTRPLSFHTRFGSVSVERKRVMHRADGSTEVPSAKAWKAPQHDYMTRGLRHAVCDELRDRTVRRACQSLGERAGQADFLNDATALDILHREGTRLIAAQRDRAEAIRRRTPRSVIGLSRESEGLGASVPRRDSRDVGQRPAGGCRSIADRRWVPGSRFAESREVHGTEQEPSVSVPPDRRRRVDPHWVLAELDEVKVKAQAIWDGKEIWLYTATVLVEEKTYYFAEATKDTLFDQLAALLSVLGVLDGKRQLLALADGALWIRSWFEFLRLPGKQMILCWYHLAKRCYQRLSAGGFPKARPTRT